MAQVRILNGSYRNSPVVNQTFTLVKGFQTGAKGSYVTVKNDGHFAIAIDNVKVKVDSIDELEFTGAETAVLPSKTAVATVTESDEVAMNRIATRFSILDEMSHAVINSDIRAMIVTGPPGVGKSHGVTLQMEKATMFDTLKGVTPRFEIVKGAISGIGLFALLYKFSDSKNVLVFDDCDVWEDQDALNVLKGALDSGKTRRISWNKDSRILREEGIPNSFDFHGSVIFITNKTFDSKRASKIQPHMDALQSRCHFLDLTINTERDKMLRIKQVHRDADGGLFASYDFDGPEADYVIDYMDENATKLREVSMRCALKIADLVKISPNNWRTLADATVCKN